MTNKSGVLSQNEKKRIEDLVKCSRERKRKHIVDRLTVRREIIEKPFSEQIEELQRQSETIRVARENAVRSSGYGKIYERGCYDTHPDLDKFDSETNQILIDLWKASTDFKLEDTTEV